MKNPVVLITGALTGIGRAAAIIFAQEGAHIVVSGRRDKQGQELAAELKGLGAEAIFVRTDVRKDEDVRNLVDQTVKRFGRLDIAVNNAGTEGTPGPVTEQTAETYAASFDTNVLGTLLSMKHEMRVMLAQRSGSIVNVSSTCGILACGPLHILREQARSRRTDQVGRARSRRIGVSVNLVTPGPIETALLNRFAGTAQKKGGFGSDRAAQSIGKTRRDRPETIMLLASDKASFVTGARTSSTTARGPGDVSSGVLISFLCQ